MVNVERYGNTSSGSIPLALADARADGRLRDGALVLMTGMGAGLTWGSALVEWTDRRSCMTKVAFCFPGQGSLEVGMGREIAEAVPEAMEVYRVGSEATGMDLARLCFESPLEELVETEVQQPTLVATSLAILAARAEAGHRAGRRRRALGRRVRGAGRRSARCRTGEAIGLVRERGLAMAEAARQRPGAMAAILGLEDEAVETLCRKILGVWPANYNCPGQIVVSGENDAVEECCAEAESLGARRAIRLKVSGAFHSPLVAQAGRRAQAGDRQDPLRRAPSRRSCRP